MERISFDAANSFSGLEAAIHIARYALVRNLCQGKKVLDIACGEGYGSRLLLDWGASEVVGVDISESAIASARKHFAKPGVRYLCCDAQKIDHVISDEKFDLIISIETLEHLEQPEEYLGALGRLRAKNACLLITCPNDWWYYPTESERNIYHVRKYHYEEFIKLVTASLGEPSAVGIGLPSIGFINLPVDRANCLATGATQIEMMKCFDNAGDLIIPPEPNSVSNENSSYFIAAWGIDSQGLMGAATLPVSMDYFSAGFGQAKWTEEIKVQLNTEVEALRKALEDTRGSLTAVRQDLQSALKEQRRLGLLWHASQAESAVIRDAMRTSQGATYPAGVDFEMYRMGYHRYVRLTRLVPASLRSIAVKVARFLRSRGLV